MNNNTSEISLETLILDLKRFLRYLLARWIFIALLTLSGAFIGYMYALYGKPKYIADLSFVLSSDAKSSNGLAGIASQFGMDLNGANNDVFSGDNIISLMTSRRMVEKVLFKRPAGSNETLINIIIDQNGVGKAWRNIDRLKNMLPFPENKSLLSPTQDSLVREIYVMLVKEVLSVSKPDKKQSIFQVRSTSGSEIFSVYLTRYLVDETSKFYIATKTKVAKQNLDMLQHEADSLRILLGGVITNTAAAVDQTFNLNSALMVNRSVAQKGQINATVIAAAYTEVVKNLEIAKITLLKETPLFQIIDEPTLPLIKKKLSKTRASIVAALLFAMLGASVLMIRMIKDKTKENKIIDELA